jgi:hypothetical protein
MYKNAVCPEGLETEALQLEDGSTLLIQEIPKFLDGHTVQLEDGTTAFVHPNIKAEGNFVMKLIYSESCFIFMTSTPY